MSKGGNSGNQTVTQQNIPDWAMDYAQNTLDMGNQYTMNPNYRPSTLDRDYSGIRGYNAQGEPNSKVGQSGLNPMPVQPMPVIPPEETTKRDPYTGKLNSQKMSQFNHGDPDGDGTFDTPLTFRPGQGFFLPNGNPYNSTVVGSGDQITQYYGDPDGDGTFDTPIERGPDGFYQSMPVPSSTGAPRQNNGRPVPMQNQPMPVSVPDDLLDTLKGRQNSSQPGTGGRTAIRADAGGGTAIANDSAFQGGADTFNFNPGAGEVISGDNSNTPGAWSAEDVRKAQAGLGKMTVADGFVPFENTTTSSGTSFDSSQMTPFSAYDRQRFAAPSDRTRQGEDLLANRVNGPNPFAEAQAAARGASNYRSGFSPASLNLQGPTANSYNNVLSGLRNVNANLRSAQYGNANQGLLGAQDYGTGQSFQESVQNFMNPYTDQVVNSTLKDINRARQMADLSTMGGAAKSGAFGGSREALMRAENTRNALDQAASTAGQLRSQGFNTAANLTQQEKLQKLGLTASDRQNVRGYQSAGNLQGQSLTAKDLQDVRGLQSQGALAAQGLDAQGALTAQGLGAQSDRDVMSLQQQLQRQGNQLGVEQARLAEQFRQGAGALNLQGAGALGNLAQMQTADERQRIADLLASGGAGDARNQQDLDFIFNEFNRELAYPGQQIDLRNAAISPATGSIVTTSQPRYQASPLAQAGGPALAMYAATSNPYLAAAAAAYGLLNDEDE